MASHFGGDFTAFGGDRGDGVTVGLAPLEGATLVSAVED
ncbi:hypothetical protein CC_1289 [Caulobacter vibrioides CB15]|uniref:Uncharacterized protein n=1 Tax=Caulobacter vibrioides (strain ATCC 19089 / CIP 103742 / CB 15) TaxID=190650 RepID=Q9A8R2_CAUVC|nr:hypothetical protein CC_1289 [Caulobacter vibrioides CB15]AVH77078.1 hypothetical protein CA607_20360 [Caulobacter vibrioides]